MHAIVKKKRFSLLFLEEGEIYTRDCTGFRQHPDMFPNPTQEKGRIHLCSKSLIFEPEDANSAIIKYAFIDIVDIPEEVLAPSSLINHTESATRLNFQIKKITFLPDANFPSPYKPNLLESPQEVYFDLLYENITTIINWVKDLYILSRQNQSVDRDLIITELVSQREKGVRFDLSRIMSYTENPLAQTIMARRIHPMTNSPVLLYITDACIYIQSIYRMSSNPVKHVKYADISKLYKRRWKLQEIGLEFFTEMKKSMFLAFQTENERNEIFDLLSGLVPSACETENSLDLMLMKWQARQISNYDYLLYLNSAAHRTFSDFTQYPVFPWIISNYQSDDLDLADPSNFRDLSKPIGALNPSRLENYKNRCKYMPDPKFLYGTHYSSPGYVVGFLFRKYPIYMFKLNGGKFDSPDRLFYDISNEWKSVNENPSDVKELIPEFFSDDPSFLINSLGLDFGTKMSGEKVWDVKLPPWAKNPKDFLSKMKDALECEFVSDNLHKWIDLIFGYKQRGDEAWKAGNVFHPYTYEGNINIDEVSDLVERKSIEQQISEFGQTPKQLFTNPHPQRNSNTNIIHTFSEDTLLWNSHIIASKTNDDVSEITLHKKRISSINELNNQIITTGHDGCIKVLTLNPVKKRSFPICDLAISCSAIINEKNIVSGSYDSKLYVFNLSTGRVVDKISAHSDAISCCLNYEELGFIATGSWDCHINLWDLRDSANPFDTFESHEERISAMCKDVMALRPDLMISADILGKIVVRDIRKGVLGVIETNSQINDIKYSLKNNHILSADTEGIKEYETQGKLVNSFEISDVNCFDTDGSFLICGRNEEGLELWNIEEKQIVSSWKSISKATAIHIGHHGEEIFIGNELGLIYTF
ncbi:NSMAF_3 [Blepharisma stoltei]|uniref:Uncharacterized protein n=1 Tax=Blepharisma stoltei TaxID=1481888 RepID=A0AAU9J8Y6_9CILI|nr:unnamed protein product [Blepharisma stoltei]